MTSADRLLPIPSFHQFELDGWEQVAQPYDQGFGPLTSQAVPFLLRAAAPLAQVRLLDVASGPGYVAAAAAKEGARVTAVDFSSSMVERARATHPEIQFEQGDAQALPFAAGTFQAVTINFGVLHFEKPELALAEAHRVLQSGGRVAFSVWAMPTEAKVFGIVADAVRQYGNAAVPIPVGPPFFRFSDPAECRSALQSAGFERILTTSVPLVWKHAQVETVWKAVFDGTVRTAGLLRAQPTSALQDIRRAVERALEEFRTSEGLQIPMPAVVTSAIKP